MENEDLSFELLPDSRQGLTGLFNLGLTCYLNTAVQCLSHTDDLTRYFLARNFDKELNVDNVLGHEGKIAKSYARLINHLWVQDKPVFVPNFFNKLI